MQKSKNISEATIKRLPRYYRYLKELEQQNIERVSSEKLALLLSITASKVRQDFCTFGAFGMQGYGYDVTNLRKEIGAILGLDKEYNVIIIGAGNIGKALYRYSGFSDEGFRIKAIFDIDVENNSFKNKANLLHIDELNNYLYEHPVDIAVICTQKEMVVDLCNKLKECGITSVWNFAPIDVVIPGMVIENINMSESLFLLSYRMNNNK